jgi:endonuclease/exonuclease/phosphatase family metal-dependent hydrolase
MITVASYNIRKGIGTDRLRRPERILDVIEEVNPDIIAIQEADRRFGSRAAALPLEMIADKSRLKPVAFDTRPKSIGWHGNAVLIRQDFEVMRHDIIRIPSLEPRGAVVADINIRNQHLRVVGMHLDLSGLWRRRQARFILDYLAALPDTVPTVMMGDLNEWSLNGGCLREFGAQFRIAHTGPSFHARRPFGRLDRIMAGHGVHLIDAGTHNSARAIRASDHLPVWARVTLPT